MSESTNKLSGNTYPETPRLLFEGTILIDKDDISAVSDGWENIAIDGEPVGELNISNLLNIGDRVKGFPPQTIKIEMWHTTKTVSGGTTTDTSRVMPYVIFEDRDTGEVSESVGFKIQTQSNITDQTSAAFLSVQYFSNTQPTRDLSFAYKIYSTIFGFDDT